MKFFTLLLGLFSLTVAASGQTLVVLNKEQLAWVGPAGTIWGVPDSNAGKQRFLSALAVFAKERSYDAKLPLEAPPEWGRTVPGSGGEVQYLRSFAQGFVAHLALEHLTPQHTYLLTLNGTPGQPGNQLLPDPVPGLPEERFYDFLRVVTNKEGKIEADLGIYLLPGRYHVRIYVKDTTDFKIVLYRDFFDFVVTPDREEPKPAVTRAP